MRPGAVSAEADPDGAGRMLARSFLGPTSRVTATVGETVVVAQVASALIPSLTPGTAVSVRPAPAPVALDL